MLRSPYTEELIQYARHFLGRPYVYGANGPNAFDCSGFVCFVLRRSGVVNEDLAAQGIYDKLKKTGTSFTKRDLAPPGSLLFYGKDNTSIDHVAITTDLHHVIEAGGGNSRTDSVEKANQLGACVRERPINHRSDLVCAVYPRYPWA
jgi:cell wall-associated NlpC family hydrolase